MFPNYWRDFAQTHCLIGSSVVLGESDDLSGLGADMQFLDEKQATEELAECWPGIAVASAGYVPVAWCSLGSGDYYWINRHDGAEGPLYRIYHDAVSDGHDVPADAIDTVLSSYVTLLGRIER